MRGVENGLLISHCADNEQLATPNEKPRIANAIRGKNELVEVAGVEGRRKSSQALGTTESCELSTTTQTPTCPLSADESGQMLAKIVANWHKLPDDTKREIAELTGM